MSNRGRFQAQGGNTEKSAPWTQDETLYKSDGIDLLNVLRSSLTRSELNDRQLAIQKARHFVNGCPKEGISPITSPIRKSFSNSLQNRSIRIDVEVRSGIAFVTKTQQQNGR